jgi:hypothetical protein
VGNTSIELLGVVPKEKLKELLAISDYGLAPVFSHSAGTFLKTLTYISAGLDIITSTFGVVGVNIPKGINIYLVKNKQELVKVVREIVYRYDIGKGMNSNRLIALCERTSSRVEDILKLVENPRAVK